MFKFYSNTRRVANETFNHVLWQGRRSTLVAQLRQKSSGLKNYDEAKEGYSLQRQYLGLKNIPASKIVGTIGRTDDFDSLFRPIRDHLRERWVEAAVQSGGAGWRPIKVIKAGQEYFIIDGHHRTSFARCTGIKYMSAEVWEAVPETCEVINPSAATQPAGRQTPLPTSRMAGCEPAEN